MSRPLAWLIVIALFSTAACRELLDVDEASLDPGPSDASDGAGGQGGDGG